MVWGFYVLQHPSAARRKTKRGLYVPLLRFFFHLKELVVDDEELAFVHQGVHLGLKFLNRVAKSTTHGVERTQAGAGVLRTRTWHSSLTKRMPSQKIQTPQPIDFCPRL